MSTILISGGTGFIGKNFAEFSSFRNHKCISLRNTDPGSVDFSGADTVLHLAAIVHKTHGVSTSEYYRVNKDLTISFARAARSAGVKQFVFLSTSKVYGDKRNDFPLKEDSACDPADDYGRSKYEAEQELSQLNNEEFVVTIIRTPVVYGKGMKANMLNLTRLVRYLPVLPLDNICNIRNYTYVGNLVGYIDKAINLRIPGILIAMDNDSVSTSELAHLISDAFGYRRLFLGLSESGKIIIGKIFQEYSKRLFGSFILDNSRTRQMLTFNPPFSTEAGIKKTIKDLYPTS